MVACGLQHGSRSPAVVELAESASFLPTSTSSPQLQCPTLNSHAPSYARQPQPTGRPTGHPSAHRNQGHYLGSISTRKASRSSWDGSLFGIVAWSLAGSSSAASATLVMLLLLTGSVITILCTSTWILSDRPLNRRLRAAEPIMHVRAMHKDIPGWTARSMTSEAGTRSVLGPLPNHELQHAGSSHTPDRKLPKIQMPEKTVYREKYPTHNADMHHVAAGDDPDFSQQLPNLAPSSESDRRKEDQNQHQPDQQERHPRATAALNMSEAEAAALSELFFSKVFPADGPVIPELRLHPQALHLMSLLRRLWQAHAMNATTKARQLLRDHCSTSSGAKLLQGVLEAAQKLQQESCSNSAASLASSKSAPSAVPSDPGLPFVVLRRISILVLHLAYQQGAHSGPSCAKALHSVAPKILLSFAASFECSRSSRLAMELFHISKSGGTSMCQLAGPAGLKNPSININANCLLPTFDDEPKWTQAEAFMLPQHHFWAAVNCSEWVQQKQLTCSERASRLHSNGINFYANELTLHEGNATLGSAAPCPQLETVMVLRQPLERARSHIIEVDRVYGNYRKHSQDYVRGRDLQQWQRWAPAVLDNFMVRSMLGREPLCRPFGSMGDPELLAAMLTLTSVDHVLLLEEDFLTDVVIRAGMGWKQGLGSKHWRWSAKHELTTDLHFPEGTTQQLEAWNLLDQDLYQWGKVLLRLDAAFHTAVAALNGRTECIAEPDAQAAEPGAEDAVSAATGSDTTSEAQDIDHALAHVGLKRLNGNVVLDSVARAAAVRRRAAVVAAQHGSIAGAAAGAPLPPRPPPEKVAVKFIYGFANVDVNDPTGGGGVPLVSSLLPIGLDRLFLAGGSCGQSPKPAGNKAGSAEERASSAGGGGGHDQRSGHSGSSILNIKLPLYSSTRSTGQALFAYNRQVHKAA